MGQRLIKRVSAADIVEGLDAQGHSGEPIPKEAGGIRSDTTSLARVQAAAGIYHELARSRPMDVLPKCRQGQGSAPGVQQPRRAARQIDAALREDMRCTASGQHSNRRAGKDVPR